jgi:hypothetical protein
MAKGRVRFATGEQSIGSVAEYENSPEGIQKERLNHPAKSREPPRVHATIGLQRREMELVIWIHTMEGIFSHDADLAGQLKNLYPSDLLQLIKAALSSRTFLRTPPRLSGFEES